VDKFQGSSGKNVALLFEMAKDLSPSILFFDEAEHLFGSRQPGENQSKSEGITSVTLLLLDFMTEAPTNNIFIVACSNYPWLFDEAFGRRFTSVLVDMPTREVCFKIIKLQKKYITIQLK
jgi:SpoVK/Ycf46/Vps4 family AAA+-type ATPase